MLQAKDILHERVFFVWDGNPYSVYYCDENVFGDLAPQENWEHVFNRIPIKLEM